MKNAPMPVAEITTKAIKLLCREIGPVNTARFLNQFTTGFGNYTEERANIVGNPTVDELIAEIRKKRPRSRREKKTRSASPSADRR